MKVTIFRKDGSKSVIKRCYFIHETLFTCASPFRYQLTFLSTDDSILSDDLDHIERLEDSVFLDQIEKIEIDPVPTTKKYID